MDVSAVPTKQYQTRMTAALRRAFKPTPVQSEWKAFESVEDLYSPRLDIAVGPFSTTPGSLTTDYDGLDAKYRSITEKLQSAYELNLSRFATRVPGSATTASPNRNARCFLAIEIENRVSRKHLMGGALNAAALGRWGIVVGWDEGKVKALLRLREYMLELKRVGKPTFSTLANLIIVSPDQFRASLTGTA
jgi:hypothetical protein